MTKTLQRCTHDSNRRRSQFWLLYLTLEFKNTHTLTQTHTKTHELNTFDVLVLVLVMVMASHSQPFFSQNIFCELYSFRFFILIHFVRCIRLWFSLALLVLHSLASLLPSTKNSSL